MQAVVNPDVIPAVTPVDASNADADPFREINDVWGIILVAQLKRRSAELRQDAWHSSAEVRATSASLNHAMPSAINIMLS